MFFSGPGAPESENDAEMVPKWGPIIVYFTSGMHPFCRFYSVLAPRVPQGAFLSHFDTIFAHFGTKMTLKLQQIHQMLVDILAEYKYSF